MDKFLREYLQSILRGHAHCHVVMVSNDLAKDVSIFIGDNASGGGLLSSLG